MRETRQPGGQLSKSSIVRVTFHQPVDGARDWFFGSASAIFEKFTPEQIGASKWKLWAAHVGKGASFTTAKCIITREELYRLKQRKEEL